MLKLFVQQQGMVHIEANSIGAAHLKTIARTKMAGYLGRVEFQPPSVYRTFSVCNEHIQASAIMPADCRANSTSKRHF